MAKETKKLTRQKIKDSVEKARNNKIPYTVSQGQNYHTNLADIFNCGEKTECDTSFLKFFVNEQKNNTIIKKKKLILNTIGIDSETNTFITSMIELINIASITTKCSGMICSGENSMGKSALLTLVFKDLAYIYSGIPTEAELRGSKITSNSLCLFEKIYVVFEEFNDTEEKKGNFIKELKQVIESGFFQKNGLEKTNCEVFIKMNCNSYKVFKSFKEINYTNLSQDIPQAFNDKGFCDRIPFHLPYFKSFMGNKYYVSNDDIEGINIIEFAHIILALRDVDYSLSYVYHEEIEKELENNFNDRDWCAINKLTSAIIKIFYPDLKDIPTWFIRGVIEFVLFFRTLRKPDTQAHNPFNKKSARFILEILGYSTQNIEYIFFDEDRICIKLREKNECLKIALTGFALEKNNLEFDFFKRGLVQSNFFNAPIELMNNGILMLQEMNGDIPFEERIYFDNLLEKQHSNEKTDKEFNDIIINNIQYLAKSKNEFDKNIRFRGIPNFMLNMIKNNIISIFKINISEKDINKIDFTLDKNGEIKLLNYYKYIKNQ